MIVAYATLPDQVAEDGKSSRNSPFTAALLARMDEPGLEIGTLFRRVQGDVLAKTGGKQRPELNISLATEFFLNTSETDTMAWERVREFDDMQAIRDFIAKYPRSSHLPDAKFRLDVLERAVAAQAEDERARKAEEERVKAQQAALAKAEEDRARLTKDYEAKTAAMAAEQAAQAKLLEAERAKAQQEALAKAHEESERLAKEFAQREADLQAKLAAKAAETSKSADETAKAEENARKSEAERVAKLEQELAELRAPKKQDARPDQNAAAEREKFARELAAKEASLNELKAKEAEALKDAAAKEQARRDAEDKAQRDALAQIEQLKREKAEAERRLAEQKLAIPASSGSEPGGEVNTPALVKAAQLELKRIGCFSSSISGNYTAATLNAIEQYRTRKDGHPGSGDVNARFIEELKAQPARLCPLTCDDGEKIQGDKCVRIPPRIVERPPAREEREEPAHHRAERPAPAPRHAAAAPAPRREAAPRPAPAPEPVAHNTAVARSIFSCRTELPLIAGGSGVVQNAALLAKTGFPVFRAPLQHGKDRRHGAHAEPRLCPSRTQTPFSGCDSSVFPDGGRPRLAVGGQSQ